MIRNNKKYDNPTDYSKNELVNMKLLQKQHLKSLMKQFFGKETDDDIDNMVNIVFKCNTYHELHMESLRRKFENSFPQDIKEIIRWDRIIRKIYLKVITIFHDEDCDCSRCIKESLIGRCCGVVDVKPSNLGGNKE